MNSFFAENPAALLEEPELAPQPEIPSQPESQVDQLLRQLKIRPDLAIQVRQDIRDLPEPAQILWVNEWQKSREYMKQHPEMPEDYTIRTAWAAVNAEYQKTELGWQRRTAAKLEPTIEEKGKDQFVVMLPGTGGVVYDTKVAKTRKEAEAIAAGWREEIERERSAPGVAVSPLPRVEPGPTPPLEEMQERGGFQPASEPLSMRPTRTELTPEEQEKLPISKGPVQAPKPAQLERQRVQREEQEALRRESPRSPEVPAMMERLQELLTKPDQDLTTEEISAAHATIEQLMRTPLSKGDRQALEEMGLKMPAPAVSAPRETIGDLIQRAITTGILLKTIEDPQATPEDRAQADARLTSMVRQHPEIHELLDREVRQPRQRAIAEQKTQEWLTGELGRLTEALAMAESEEQADVIRNMIQQYTAGRSLPSSTSRGLFRGFFPTRQDVRNWMEVRPSGPRKKRPSAPLPVESSEEDETPMDVIKRIVNSAKEVAPMPRTAKIEFNAKIGKWNVLHASLINPLAFDTKEQAEQVARSMDGGTDPSVRRKDDAFQVTHPDWDRPVAVRTAAEAQEVVERKLQDLGDSADEAKTKAQEIVQKAADEKPAEPPATTPEAKPQEAKPQEVTAAMEIKAEVSQVSPGAPNKPLVSGLPKTDVSAPAGKHPQVPGVSATEGPAVAALEKGKSGEHSLKSDNAKSFDADVKKVQNAHGITRETQKLLMSCSLEEQKVVEQKLAEAQAEIEAKRGTPEAPK